MYTAHLPLGTACLQLDSMDSLDQASLECHLRGKSERAEIYHHSRCFKLTKLQRKHVMISDPALVNHIVRKYLLKEKLVGSDLAVHFNIHLMN